MTTTVSFERVCGFGYWPAFCELFFFLQLYSSLVLDRVKATSGLDKKTVNFWLDQLIHQHLKSNSHFYWRWQCWRVRQQWWNFFSALWFHPKQSALLLRLVAHNGPRSLFTVSYATFSFSLSFPPSHAHTHTHSSLEKHWDITDSDSETRECLKFIYLTFLRKVISIFHKLVSNNLAESFSFFYTQLKWQFRQRTQNASAQTCGIDTLRTISLPPAHNILINIHKKSEFRKDGFKLTTF